MKSKERILSAINHNESDRVPVDLGATGSSGISVVAYQNLLNYLGKKHLKNYSPDVVQQCSQPDMEILDLFDVDVVDVGRHFNTDENYWHELELIKDYPILYPGWFKPEKQSDGSWLAPGKTGEYIGKMPLGATFFDQTIFPYIDGYPVNFKKLGHEMTRVVWGGFGFTPFDWADEPDFWEMLRDKTLDLRSTTDKALLLGYVYIQHHCYMFHLHYNI